MLRLWPFNGSGRATAFTVHEPPEASGTKIERAERLVFVRDGFSWRAALFSPFYLLMRSEWLALAAYIAAAVAMIALLNAVGASGVWIGWGFVLLNAIAGFEVSEIKRWSLARGGWKDLGTVSGPTAEDAERRFFDVWLPTLAAEPLATADPLSLTSTTPPHREAISRAEGGLHRLAARLRGATRS